MARARSRTLQGRAGGRAPPARPARARTACATETRSERRDRGVHHALILPVQTSVDRRQSAAALGFKYPCRFNTTCFCPWADHPLASQEAPRHGGTASRYVRRLSVWGAGPPTASPRRRCWFGITPMHGPRGRGCSRSRSLRGDESRGVEDTALHVWRGSITSAFAWLAGHAERQVALVSVFAGEVELTGPLSIEEMARAVALAQRAESRSV